MARQKQPTPIKRTPSSELIDRPYGTADASVRNRRGIPGADADVLAKSSNGPVNRRPVPKSPRTKAAGLTELLVCVGGIYASFLSWAVLQERITTTPYGPSRSSVPSASTEQAPEIFHFPIFLNTVQSSFAALVGYIYLFLTTLNTSGLPPLVPSTRALPPLALVAVTSSLASPFGYASLKHVDYITFILAKSCKLLPVMALHLTVFRKSYPLYKYAVVGLVTAGVAIFTLHQPSANKAKTAASDSVVSGNSAWGLLLLSINLLFDGLTNSTQDHIFQTFKPFSGPQMMCVQNLLNTALTVSYMFAKPWLARQGIVHRLGLDLGSGAGEFREAMAFLRRHPGVGRDVLLFAATGAVGQVFIFYTLSHFSSLLLVTVTVTRKMLTMMLSVLWFGHRLTRFQWLGVALVFGGISAEGVIQRREKRQKERAMAGGGLVGAAGGGGGGTRGVGRGMKEL